MNHQPSNEKCQLGNEKLSPPLFTYWLALCGRPRWEQHTASNGMISLGGKRAVTVNLVGGCGIAINEGGEKKHKQNKSIIGPTVWNHTLSKLVLKQSILHQLLYNLLLKLFSPLLFSIPLSMWGSTQHFTVPCKVFYTAPLLIKEIRATERERERVHEGYRVFIYYPSPILMQPLCSKKRLLIYSFYEAFEKRWHCKRVGRSD